MTTDLRVLLQYLRVQYVWLIEQAREYESGQCRHLIETGGGPVDNSSQMAVALRHHADNLGAVISAYQPNIEDSCA